MKYYREKYKFGNATAIEAWNDDGPYAPVSVNIKGISETLPENQIVLNHNLYKMRDLPNVQEIFNDLVKEVVRLVRCGFVETAIVELNDNWKEICYENIH